MNIKQRKRLEQFEETEKLRMKKHIPRCAPDIFFIMLVLAIFLLLVIGGIETVNYFTGE
jgi:hypothetical protein